MRLAVDPVLLLCFFLSCSSSSPQCARIGVRPLPSLIPAVCCSPCVVVALPSSSHRRWHRLVLLVFFCYCLVFFPLRCMRVPVGVPRRSLYGQLHSSTHGRGRGTLCEQGGGVSLVAHFCGGPPPFFFCVCSGRCPSFLPSPHHFSFIDSLALFFRVSSLSSASPLPLYLRGFQSYIASSKPKDALIDRLWVQHSEQK